MEVQEKVDQQKLEAFLGKAVSDFGSAVSAALVLIGDKLGLYKAMAHGGPLTSAELARRTGTTERYVREWLVNQAAGGYVDYNPATGTYSLPHEHAIALADEKSPFFVGGGFQVITAMMKAEDRIAQAFLSGDGMFWGEHDHNLFEGTERFFRPGYAAHLVASWIPALDGVKAKLERGAAVADVGCGHGASTIIMALAYPKSRFFGFDNHAPSINRAHRSAHEAGVADRVVFESPMPVGEALEGTLGTTLQRLQEGFHLMDVQILLQQVLVHGLAREAWATVEADRTLTIHLRPYPPVKELAVEAPEAWLPYAQKVVADQIQLNAAFNPETFGALMSQLVYRLVMAGSPLVDARGSGFDPESGRLRNSAVSAFWPDSILPPWDGLQAH